MNRIEYFKAKDIQVILNIKKIRYEYLASKIGIKPDIEEVEGTGRAHLYSYKNLFQLAIAHNAHKLGLSFREVKKLFDYLKDYGKTADLPTPPEIDKLKDLRAQVDAKNYPEYVPVLSPKEIRERLETGKSWPEISEADKKKMLSVLDQEIQLINDEWKSNKLFASGIDINISVHCAYYGDFLIIFVKGKEILYYHDLNERFRELKDGLEKFKGEELEEHKRYFIPAFIAMGKSKPHIDWLTDSGSGSIPSKKILNDLLEKSDGYITINLKTIKKSINRKLEYE
jgi:hypothetical protein